MTVKTVSISAGGEKCVDKDGNMREIDKQEYINSFIKSSAFPDKAEKIHEKAYEIANDNRKLEIENYWKRTNYYWLFQAAVYAGYFYSITAQNAKYLYENPEIIVGITCLGFLTAFTWYLTNRGSRHWLDNWENHVFELEDGITGPLYKTTGNEKTWSVTKINKLVSLFSSVAWVLLGLKTVQSFFCWCPLAFAAYLFIIALIISIFCFYGRTSVKHKEIHWFRGQRDEKPIDK